MLHTKASRSGSSGVTIASEHQFTLTITIRKNVRGEWQFTTSGDNTFGVGGMDAELAEKLANAEMSTTRRDQQELSADKPFDLLNFPSGDFHIWIEPMEELPPTRSKATATK